MPCWLRGVSWCFCLLCRWGLLRPHPWQGAQTEIWERQQSEPWNIMAEARDWSGREMENLWCSKSGTHLGVKSINLSYPTSKLVSGLLWAPTVLLIMKPCGVGPEVRAWPRTKMRPCHGAGNSSLIQPRLIWDLWYLPPPGPGNASTLMIWEDRVR